MRPLLVVGGVQARAAGAADRNHGTLYGAGIVAELDPIGREWVVRLRWRDPEWQDAAVGHVFKGASWDGPLLLLCTERALVWVDPERWEVVRTWSHPWLNDVHHAVRWGGRLWVASTGIDGVVEVDGDRVALHGCGGPVAPPDRDVRAADLAPHAVHPNHLFAWDGALWCTRFHAGDAWSIAPAGRTLAAGRGRLHDGVVHGDRVWFTAVDGTLVPADRSGGGAIALQAPDDTGEPLGWCRGLWVEDDGEAAWVGFTRIRATRFREHLAWARGLVRGEQHATRRPTRVERRDLQSGALLGAWETAEAGIDAVFAILPRS